MKDASDSAEVKAIRAMAAVALGGMMHDFLRVEKKSNKELEDFQKSGTELAKGLSSRSASPTTWSSSSRTFLRRSASARSTR